MKEGAGETEVSAEWERGGHVLDGKSPQLLLSVEPFLLTPLTQPCKQVARSCVCEGGGEGHLHVE